MVNTRTISLFAGAWSLINNTRTDNGTPLHDSTYGNNPEGLLYYLPEGFMAACLSSTDAADRPQDLTLPFKPNQSDAEWAKIGRHSLAYAGPFTLDDSSIDVTGGDMTGNLTHGPIYTSTLPAYVGSYQHRQFQFSDNYTHLTLITDLGGGLVDHLSWQRFDRDIEFGTITTSKSS